MKSLTLTPMDLQVIERSLIYSNWGDCVELREKLKSLMEYGRENHEVCDSITMEWKQNKKGA